MIELSELLSELRARDITLTAREGALKLSAREGALTPELQARILQHKAALLSLLSDVAETPAAPKTPLVRLSSDGPRPLSYAQERIWFIESMTPGTPLHNLGLALHIEGELQPELLERALSEIVRRHDVLRLRIVGGHEPRQRFEPAAPVTLQREPLAQGEQPLREHLAALCERPFDLTREAPVRFHLLERGTREHVLVAIAHHLAWDGRSNDLFRHELLELYDAYRTSRAPVLAAPSLSYADFAAYSRSADAAGDYAAQLAFWKQTFTPLPEPLDMPSDFPRPRVRSAAGATVVQRFPSELVSALRALARTHDATLQMLLLSALSVVLARFSGQNDVVLGLAYDQRERAELDALIGCFVNTLPLRLRVKGDEPFTELLGRARSASLAALAHSAVPFERVVEALSPPRDLSRTPLYQVMFSYQERTPEPAGPLALRELTLPTGGAATDLFVWVGHCDGELVSVLDYASELFSEATAKRILAAWTTLLEGVVAAPRTEVARLPLVPEADRTKLVRELNATATPLSFRGRVHELIEAQAARTPDAPALLFEEQVLSYRELNERANRLAHALLARGIGREQLVGVAVTRSLELPIALLGVIKTGAAYVPLDPNYPVERIRSMAEDAEVAIIVADSAANALFDDASLPRFVLEAEADALAHAPTHDPHAPGDAADRMYVIYTSGSTGKPKGVMVEHQNVVNFFEGMRQRLTLSEPGTWLSATSVSFDISVLEIFGSLSHGFRLAFVGNTYSGVAEDPRYSIAPLLERHRVTHFQCTPSQALILLSDPEAKRALHHVREMLVGGEALGLDVARQLLDSISGRLLNMYGPTETTIWSSTSEVARDAPITLGKPIANTTFYSLSPERELAPFGVMGELYIGGLGVTRGYLKRPELSAERFVHDPFASEPGARIYRTGDLVRIHEHGALEFLGRNDFQVKVRGYRIELGEIEEALRALAHAREAVVVARDDGRGDVRLVAYVVPTADTPRESAEVRALVRTRLPEYMVPSAVVQLEALPLTGSGKVDRKQLPDPGEQTEAQPKASVEPGSELERKLVACWAEVLKTSQVGVDDNFFDLGGHSLLMGRLAESIAAAVGRRVTVPELFQYPSVRSLARQLDTSEASTTKPTANVQATQRRAAVRNTQGRRG